MWKILMKSVELDEPTSFHDHVYLGCTQSECKPNEFIIARYREMFESRIPAIATETTRVGETSRKKRLRGPATWKDMLENSLRDIANW